jgi:uncharacterized protein YjbJ (UPF0337 family)
LPLPSLISDHKIKDTAGKVTGDKKLQSEGKADKAKGAVHNIAGDIKTP